MRSGIWLIVAVLTLGGVSEVRGGVVIDMPAPPVTAGTDAERTEPSGSAEALKLGDVALSRFARSRWRPSYTSMAPGWWGRPHERHGYGYGYRYGFHPFFPWVWNGWGYPYYGFYPYHGHHFYGPRWGYRWRGPRFTFRGRRP
jgi:hypothetical protein